MARAGRSLCAVRRHASRARRATTSFAALALLAWLVAAPSTPSEAAKEKTSDVHRAAIAAAARWSDGKRPGKRIFISAGAIAPLASVLRAAKHLGSGPSQVPRNT